MTFNLLDHSIFLSPPQRETNFAWTEHVPFAMLLVELTQPHLLVELGTHTGMSYCAFCQAVTELRLDTRCFAVDTWEGDEQAGFYGPEILDDLRAHHDIRYTSFSTLLQARFDDANDKFADGSIDLLHIDGFHTYEAAKHDVDLWLPKMSARGVIALHDIAEHGDTFGVWKLWDELKATYPYHLEFVHGHGLGVVAVGETVPPGLLSLMELPSEQWLTLRDLFAEVGARLSERLKREHDRERAARERAEWEAQVERERAEWEQQRAAWDQERAALLAREESERRKVAAQEDMLRGAEQRNAETQRRLDSALWQLNWLEQSRGVRAVKLARASRNLLRQRGAMTLAKRGALWLMGKRGYYRLDSAVALPAPVPERALEREYKQVMFLSGCPGGAMRYRCDHQAEQLNLLGCSAESAAIGTVNLMDLLDHFACFVLHRVPYDVDVQAFMDGARKRGKPIFFDTDDLVFIPENARYQSELERFSPQDRAHYIEDMGRIRKTLTLADAATVSTATLRDWVAPLCERVDITPNALDRETVALSDAALIEAQAADDAASEIVIAYLSGSPSHDRDFREAQDAVLWALETYPQVTLALHGPIDVDPAFDRFGARVRREPFRSWQELPSIYAGVTINLAPLERDNPFTEAKSAVRYLEAALLKVPTIASPSDAFAAAIQPGVTGMLADTPAEWREALRELIESPERRRALGEAAYADAHQRHTTTAQANEVFRVMRDHYRAAAPQQANKRLRINWVVDRVGDDAQSEQSLSLARALAERGHTVRVCAAHGMKGMNGATAAAKSALAPLEFVADYDQAPPADLSVATSAATALLVAQRPDTHFKAHLASGEGPFSPDEERAFMAPLRQIGLGAAVAARIREVSGIEPLRLDLSADPTGDQVNTHPGEQLEKALREYCW